MTGKRKFIVALYAITAACIMSERGKLASPDLAYALVFICGFFFGANMLGDNGGARKIVDKAKEIFGKKPEKKDEE